jgi:hypothetical protein
MPSGTRLIRRCACDPPRIRQCQSGDFHPVDLFTPVSFYSFARYVMPVNVEMNRSRSATRSSAGYTRHVTHALPARLVCLRCGERKVTITSPPDQQILTFACRGCRLAWSSAPRRVFDPRIETQTALKRLQVARDALEESRVESMGLRFQVRRTIALARSSRRSWRSGSPADAER